MHANASSEQNFSDSFMGIIEQEQLLMRHQDVSRHQHCLPAASAPMKSDNVIRMGIVMTGGCRGVSGDPGLDARGSVAATSLCFV